MSETPEQYDASEADERTRQEEFQDAVAFLRELLRYTALEGSPGPLYTMGYFAGFRAAVHCLDRPDAARKWLAKRKKVA